MEYIYIVVENWIPYPAAYLTYVDAANAVKERYGKCVEAQIEECGGMTESVIDAPEDTSGVTRLYVERGINIEIHRLPINKTTTP